MSNIGGVDPAMSIILERSSTNELDYTFVMDCLKGYASPRAKLSRLIKTEALFRVKKGLYLLGPKFQRGPYCLELLANMIYGPSYVSFERALQIYGLIPEHVEVITSATAKIGKEFKTPVGHFSYTHCHPNSYSVGVTIKSITKNDPSPLIATPGKAVTDMLIFRRGKITSIKELEQILLEDLRMEEEDLLGLDLDLIRKIKGAHPHSAVSFFEKWLAHRKETKS